MKPEIKAKWVAALRSGEYKQKKGKLRGPNGFCCLGVLCDLHAKELGFAWGEEEYLKEEAHLPENVCIWTGFKDHETKVNMGGKAELISKHNDGYFRLTARTFKEISDAIEAQL